MQLTMTSVLLSYVFVYFVHHLHSLRFFLLLSLSMCFLFTFCFIFFSFFFFFNDTATTEIYTLSLHDALPILPFWDERFRAVAAEYPHIRTDRSEEHTSELQSPDHLVCRLLLEKKKKKRKLRLNHNN